MPTTAALLKEQSNKLKTEKRMMYGRAGYALLRAKLLAPYYLKKVG